MFIAGDSAGGSSAMALLLTLHNRSKEGSLDSLPDPAGAFFESPFLNLAADSPSYYSNNYAAFPDEKYAREHPDTGSLTGDIWFHYTTSDVSNVGDPFALTVINAKTGLRYCGCETVNSTRPEPALPSKCFGSCGTDTSSQAQLKHEIFSPFWATQEQLRGLPPLYFATAANEVMASDTRVFAQRAAQVGVHVRAELFEGMWHTFPQWSEGCGSGSPLWQGRVVLSHFGDFVRSVARARATCPQKLRRPTGGRGAHAIDVHEASGGSPSGPWVPIVPLGLDLCGGGRLRGSEAQGLR
mmetsp:Transcript_75500/g.196402  ORF Transcript_75500/g.196402 Transcript_75500/m.196402 type:complete len:297 (+) Transcript_75500:614-1504(+)